MSSQSPSSNRGSLDTPNSGYRKRGDMNEKTKQIYQYNIDSIKQKWGLQDIYDAFPIAIRPAGMGASALQHLKAVANHAPSLRAAQDFFVALSKNSKGEPIPATFSVVKRAKEAFEPSEGHEDCITPGETDSPVSTLSTDKSPSPRALNSSQGGTRTHPVTASKTKAPTAAMFLQDSSQAAVGASTVGANKKRDLGEPKENNIAFKKQKTANYSSVKPTNGNISMPSPATTADDSSSMDISDIDEMRKIIQPTTSQKLSKIVTLRLRTAAERAEMAKQNRPGENAEPTTDGPIVSKDAGTEAVEEDEVIESLAKLPDGDGHALDSKLFLRLAASGKTKFTPEERQKIIKIKAANRVEFNKRVQAIVDLFPPERLQAAIEEEKYWKDKEEKESKQYNAGPDDSDDRASIVIDHSSSPTTSPSRSTTPLVPSDTKINPGHYFDGEQLKHSELMEWARIMQSRAKRVVLPTVFLRELSKKDPLGALGEKLEATLAKTMAQLEKDVQEIFADYPVPQEMVDGHN